MSDFRRLAHLAEQLGERWFQMLIDPANTGAVKDFCDTVLDPIPATMTLGGRTYDILSFVRGNETHVPGHVVFERAREMSANLGEEDGRFVLEHRDEIPALLQGRIAFVFPAWRREGNTDLVNYVSWDMRIPPSGNWRCMNSMNAYLSINDVWSAFCRLLRRHT